MAERPKHIISAKDFSPEEVQHLLFETKAIVDGEMDTSDVLKGSRGAMLFYEPSLRTFISFDAAITRLGGTYQSLPVPQQTMWPRGEGDGQVGHVLDSLANTGHSYLVLRHHQITGAQIASEGSRIPVINAGEGFSGNAMHYPVEHPTQGLGDLFTIKHSVGLERGLRIALLGDLRNNPAVNSLGFLLANFPGITLEYMAPENTDLSPHLKHYLEERNILPVRKRGIDECLSADVIYVAGSNYYQPPGMPRFGQEELARVSNDSIVMFDLLRGSGPDDSIRDDGRLLHNRQEHLWVPARMALLKMLLI